MFCKEGFIGVQKDGKYFGIGCSINLFFYQLLTSIHNLFTPPIYNKVKMHTKVNYSSKKKVQFMDNIVNLTFTWVNIRRWGTAKFASEGQTRRSKKDLSFQ
jgi:hypothetical protein